jgi:hypothetical protein
LVGNSSCLNEDVGITGFDFELRQTNPHVELIGNSSELSATFCPEKTGVPNLPNRTIWFWSLSS